MNSFTITTEEASCDEIVGKVIARDGKESSKDLKKKWEKVKRNVFKYKRALLFVEKKVYWNLFALVWCWMVLLTRRKRKLFFHSSFDSKMGRRKTECKQLQYNIIKRMMMLILRYCRWWAKNSQTVELKTLSNKLNLKEKFIGNEKLSVEMKILIPRAKFELLNTQMLCHKLAALFLKFPSFPS